MAESPLPQNGRKGAGFFGWLGRQVGYVKKAVNTDVGQQIVYRSNSVEELPHPQDPGLTLRRTVIDEVVQQKKPPEPDKAP